MAKSRLNMEEVQELLKVLKKCPKPLVATKEQILDPTFEFVFQIYSDIIAQINDRISGIVGMEPVWDQPKELKNDPELELFCRISQFLKQFTGTPFYLADIYQPTSKRTKTFILILIHFLIYVEHASSNIAADLFLSTSKKSNYVVQMEVNKNELLEELSQISISLCSEEEKCIKLTSESEIVSQEYEAMQGIKEEKEKKHLEKKSKIEKLVLEIQNQECNSKLLEEEKKRLQEQLVTDEEYQSIQNMKEFLEKEDENLASYGTNMGEGLDCENQTLKYSEECLIALKNLYFGDKTLQQLQEYDNIIETKKSQLLAIYDVREKLKDATIDKQKLESEVTNLTEHLSSLENELLLVKNECTSLIHNMEVAFATFTEKMKTVHKQFDLSIANLEDAVNVLENNEEKLKRHFAERYKHILDSEHATTTNFHLLFQKLAELYPEMPKA